MAQVWAISSSVAQPVSAKDTQRTFTETLRWSKFSGNHATTC